MLLRFLLWPTGCARGATPFSTAFPISRRVRAGTFFFFRRGGRGIYRHLQHPDSSSIFRRFVYVLLLLRLFAEQAALCAPSVVWCTPPRARRCVQPRVHCARPPPMPQCGLRTTGSFFFLGHFSSSSDARCESWSHGCGFFFQIGHLSLGCAQALWNPR
jgi:hypothetical protein